MSWLHRMVARTCKRLDVCLLYQCQAGIKCLNQLVSSNQFQHFSSKDPISIPPSQLRLGFDGLCDRQTLLGVNIFDSPHFRLLETMRSGNSIQNSDYLNRIAAGTLDFRVAGKVDNRTIRNLKKKYAVKSQDLHSGNCQLIALVRVAGNWYIADGKHQAAMRALAGLDCQCVDASLLIQDSFYWWIYRKMKKDRGRYQKHIDWFEAINKTDNCSPDYL